MNFITIFETIVLSLINEIINSFYYIKKVMGSTGQQFAYGFFPSPVVIFYDIF